jgi:hypothetical protein
MYSLKLPVKYKMSRRSIKKFAIRRNHAFGIHSLNEQNTLTGCQPLRPVLSQEKKLDREVGIRA